MNSNSQHGEDLIAWEKLDQPTGVFCEVGAYDGLKSSNTLIFEEAGWQGLLVEPDPHMAAICQSCRRAQTWCCAAGNPRYTHFFINKSDRGTSGLAVPGEPIPVVVCGIGALITASGFTAVDLLSIDTEGTEIEVWDHVAPFRPKVVIMEYWTVPREPDPDKIIRRMARDGYKEFARTECNLLFEPA